MLLGTLGASLLGNILTNKGINRAGEELVRIGYGAATKKQGKGIVRPGYGSMRSSIKIDF